MTDITMPHTLQMRRVVLGLLLVPMLPGFYSTLLFGQPWAFPIGLLLAYPTALLIGVPLLFLFNRRGWLAWWQLGLCGAICVLPLQLLYWHFRTPPHLEAFSLVNVLLLQVWGLFAGLTFWLLAIFGDTPVGWRELLGSWR